ncbi:MAG TPA: ABC transporter permease subunit, partial [Stellaceae bacterium]|nr:ABC transporter permease subunit [Stellaceae bacterium]
MTASDLDRPAAPRSATFVVGLVLRAASFALFLAIWEISARWAGSRTLPTIEAVAAALLDELARGELLHQLGVTLGRVLAAFLVAMAVGGAIGLAMARWRALDLLLDGWVVLLLNLPALVIAVLAYVWFGLTEAAAIGAVAVNKIPTVAVTLREGASGLDRELADVARSFRIGRMSALRHIVLPQLYPFLLVAARSGLALVWKIVL